MTDLEFIDLCASGEARYGAGAYAEAGEVFSKIVSKRPDNATALRMLGLCQLRLGDHDKALALLRRASALAPDDPHARLHFGLGLQAVGQYREAACEFRAAAPLLPLDPAPYLNLSAALLAHGDIAGSLDAAKRSRRRAPRSGETWYTLGLALLAAERLEEATQAFDRAAHLAPGLADAWVNIGVILYRQQRMDGAKQAMQRALAIAPGHQGAAANLAAFMRLTGETEAGEQLLDDILTRNPAADAARVNKAVALMQEDRAAEALALLDGRPVPRDPQLARHWQLQRSLALLQQGRIDEAKEILALVGEVPTDLAPLLAWRRTLLATALGDEEDACAHAMAVEQALAAAAGMVPEHRIMAHYDLARFWSQRRDTERAMANWTAAHRLLQPFQPFSRDRHRAFVDASISLLDRVRLHDGPRAANRDESPVFIVGMPRTGTTLAEQIIGAHRRAHPGGERSALGDVFSRLGGFDSPGAVARIAGLDQAALDRQARAYLAELHALAPAAERVVDKMPGNFLFLGLASLLFPAARIIHCVRDPRDVGLSIFTFRFYGYHPYAHDLRDLGWYIAEHDRLMAHWREAVPNPILILRLADWVEDFTGTLSRVLDFLGLPYDSACERFYEQDTRVRTVSRAQVKQPVNARGLGRWRAYETQLAPLIEELRAGGVGLTDEP
ncbi:MAG: sulfotransferase [Alphaproteobacteria bacterium]|nr:sulfotransferase [Alphaproteobacteria bacterium]